MATVEVTLTDLTFPEKLEDKFCKFRPLVSIRYRDADNKIMFAREALPGLGKKDFWECEKGNKNKPNYVRNEANHSVDMDKVDETQRQLVFNDLDVKKLELLIVEIFDVDVSGFWDKVRKEVLKVLPVAVAPFIPTTLPLTIMTIKEAFEKGTGKTVSDLEKSVIDKAMGREDGVSRSLWMHSKPLTNKKKQNVTIDGGGIQGDYSVSVRLEMT
jgi:hypothetical protein